MVRDKKSVSGILLALSPCHLTGGEEVILMLPGVPAATSLGQLAVWFFPCRVFWLAVLVGLVTWLILDTSKRPEQLISFAGLCAFVLFLFVCSKHHAAVSGCVSFGFCTSMQEGLAWANAADAASPWEGLPDQLSSGLS